jgi:hypothetical protein
MTLAASHNLVTNMQRNRIRNAANSRSGDL